MRSRAEEITLQRRALALGLGSSIAIHTLLFVGLRFGDTDGDDASAGEAYSGSAQTVATMQAYDIMITDEAAADIRASTVSTPRRRQITPRSSSSDAGRLASAERAASSPPRASSIRDRLRPRFSDPLLWVKADRSLRGVETVDRMRARIAELVDHSNDSIAAVAESESRVTDWTRRGADGSRWGATSGRFHLGNLAIPYCGGNYTAANCGLGVPLGRVEDYEHRIRAFAEIEAQRARNEFDEILEERIGAMRMRAAARRDSVQ